MKIEIKIYIALGIITRKNIYILLNIKKFVFLKVKVLLLFMVLKKDSYLLNSEGKLR